MQRSWMPIAGLAALIAFVVPSMSAESGNSGQLAYVRDTGRGTELFVMNADGSGQRRLTSGPIDNQPDWSPDGRTIVYARTYSFRSRRVRSDIFAVNAIRGGERRLTRSTFREEEPAWSPDGGQVAFVSDLGLYVMNANGRGVRRLTGLRSVTGPVWSPDGRQIAFSLWRYPGGIHLINADGSGLRRLNTRVGRVGLWSAAWSPTGDRIAFSTGATSGAIYVINPDGSGQSRLTRKAQTSSAYAWSPDGRKIVYEKTRGEGIFAINVDGTGERRLTRTSGHEFTWSPDGRRIAFASDSTGRGDIYVMNADGSGRRRLTHTRDVDGTPIWSSRG